MDIRKPAAFGVRLLASILDGFILTFTSGFIIYIFSGEFSIDWTNGVVWQLMYTLYLAVFPVLWGGYIIGKRICGIKVKRIDNQNVTFTNMIMREFVGYYLIGLVTFGLSIVVSILMIIFREDKRGIHDIIGGTYVASNQTGR
ncbi:MAG TPA: RDD family protein [Sporosarcina psychrophila]|uniref:RDD family protein n=2 Tax=Sporosarcina TaxID=1569 RepID=A0A921G3G9_SPOPS|nr:RDD family protein [Sporosarcina psychrophila]